MTEKDAYLIGVKLKFMLVNLKYIIVACMLLSIITQPIFFNINSFISKTETKKKCNSENTISEEETRKEDDTNNQEVMFVEENLCFLYFTSSKQHVLLEYFTQIFSITIKTPSPPPKL